MKIVAISDTHNQHKSVSLPEGDMIIHAGDCTGSGNGREVEKFLYWFTRLDFKYKIMIAGNHDYYLEKIANDDPENPKYPSIKSYIPENIIYLNDSGIEIEGLKIWGSPIQPWFYDWAFNRKRGADIKKHWDLIPNDTDILITHGPVYGIQDECMNGDIVGCKDLLKKVNEINPKYFICGHIHEAYGIEKVGKTTFVNASVLDENYKLKNDPVVFDINSTIDSGTENDKLRERSLSMGLEVAIEEHRKYDAPMVGMDPYKKNGGIQKTYFPKIDILPKEFMNVKRIICNKGKYIDCMSDNEVEITIEELMLRYAKYVIDKINSTPES